MATSGWMQRVGMRVWVWVWAHVVHAPRTVEAVVVGAVAIIKI